MASLINVFQVLLVFIFVTTTLAFIGYSILLLCKIKIRSDSRVAIALGLGVVSVSLASAISFRLGVPITISLMVLSIILLVSAIFRIFSARSKIRNWLATRSISGELRRFPKEGSESSWLPIFLTALIASTLLMLPVTQHGLTSWTSLANSTADYPSYVSSALIWLQGEDAFEQQQFGLFETAMVERANFEKPMVTGLLSTLVLITKLQPHQLLTVLMWVGLFLLFLSLISLTKLLFTKLTIEQTLITVAIAGSTIPMSRLYDAQPGQVYLVGLVAFTILLFFEFFADLNSHRAATVKVILVAFAIAVTFGSNFSLLLGALPLIASFILWLVFKFENGHRSKELLKMGLSSLVVSVGISIIFAPWYLKSFTFQSKGVDGFSIPLMAPHALIGLESNPMHRLPQTAVYVSWVVLIAISIGFLVRNRKRNSYLPDVVLVSGFFLNAFVLFVLYGSNSYNFGKFFGVAIAVVSPIFFASLIGQSSLGKERMVAIASAVATFSLASSLSLQVVYLPSSLWGSLKDLPSNTGKINVLVGSRFWESSLIATAINRDIDVKVLARTYSTNSEVPYFGSPYIVNSDALSKLKHSEPVEIATGIFLVDVEYPFKEEMLFTNQGLESKYNLSGNWSQPEDWGTWSIGPKSFVLVDIPQFMQTQSAVISIDANVYQPVGEVNSMDVLVNGEIKAKDIDSGSLDKSGIQIILSKAELEATEGHLAIELLAKNYFSPQDFESPNDNRSLGVGLKSIRFAINPS